MPVAFTSTSTSEAFGPSSSTSVTVSGLPLSNATAARVFMADFLLGILVGTSRGGIRRDKAHRRQRNPASVAMAVRRSYGFRPPDHANSHVEKKLQVSIEKHYTKKPD